MAEMEWHGVEDGTRNRWIRTTLILAVAIAMLATAVVFFWGRQRKQDSREQFRQSVLRGEIDAVLEQLSGPLRSRVDRPVLAAWLEHVGQIRQSRNGQPPALEIELGPDGVRSFRLASPQQQWTPHPIDQGIYQERAEEVISDLLYGRDSRVRLRMWHRSPLAQNPQNLADLCDQLGGAVRNGGPETLQSRTGLKGSTRFLQLIQPITDRSGRMLNLVIEYHFLGWQGVLYDCFLEPAPGVPGGTATSSSAAVKLGREPPMGYTPEVISKFREP